MLKLKLIKPPLAEPVTLNEIKGQLRVDDDDDSYDDVLSPLISAAREWCENYQNRAYITQTFELAFDRWPICNFIRLPRPTLQRVEQLKYTDVNGDSLLWDPNNYDTDDFSEPGYLVKCSGVAWPSTRLRTNGLIVRYVAGYGDNPEDIPETIKRAIIMLVLFWFENGVCEPPCGVTSLLSMDRVVLI